MYVQIDVATGCGSDLGWASSARGLDLRLIEPDQASELYRYAWLIGRLPVRVSIPSTPGVASAVRIAIALGMAVKLAFPPQAAYAWSELDDVLDLYLHGRFVGQPVEPFHSLLQAAFQRRRENVWRVQDEDPACVRFVSGQGQPTRAVSFRVPSGCPAGQAFCRSLANGRGESRFGVLRLQIPARLRRLLPVA